MKRFAMSLVLVAAPLVAAADTPDHVVNDAGATLTLDCGDGGRVVINGADNAISTTGGCAKVVVNGSTNTVTIAAADKIVVTGSSNTVTYKQGWKAKRPKVARLGVGNTIRRIK